MGHAEWMLSAGREGALVSLGCPFSRFKPWCPEAPVVCGGLTSLWDLKRVCVSAVLGRTEPMVTQVISCVLWFKCRSLVDERLPGSPCVSLSWNHFQASATPVRKETNSCFKYFYQVFPEVNRLFFKKSRRINSPSSRGLFCTVLLPCNIFFRLATFFLNLQMWVLHVVRNSGWSTVISTELQSVSIWSLTWWQPL